MQRQRFIATIKSVTEKKTLKSLIVFHSANKIENYNRGGKKEKEKFQKKLQTSQNIRIVNIFLESLLSVSFPSLGVQSTSPSQGDFHHRAGLLACCGGNSDANLVLLLCLLASSVHSYKKQCIFFCESSQCPFIYPIDTESAQLIVWI